MSTGFTELQIPGCDIIVFDGIDGLNSRCGNVDIEVILPDGRRFSATMFTLRNIQELMEVHALSGESGGGEYFWASDLVIVRELTYDSVKSCVNTLLREERLEEVFSSLEDIEI